MKNVIAAILLTSLVGFGGLGGCRTEEGEPGPCERKNAACHNTCYKADLGERCHGCCDDNFSSCRADAGYGFYACPDKE
jgi:hypothetical protein